MLLAPMIGVIDTCITQTPGNFLQAPESLVRSCTGPEGSAAALVELTLTKLQPAKLPHTYRLGYTLPAPLLQLFKPTGAGKWEIDNERIERLVRTVRDTNRPVILYLFSTHFSTGSPLEEELARDPVNIGQTRDGPLAQSNYYGSKIYNWSLADRNTPLTSRRLQAIHALLEKMCELSPDNLKKIEGVTLLGELHQLFPNFETGMGFNFPYRVTDYSQHSETEFRKFLKNEFRTIEQTNRILGTTYKTFEEVHPPSKDIRTEKSERYTEHMDSFAKGNLPVTGWAFVPNAEGTPRPRILVYRDGHLVGKTFITKSRQDVLQAKPEFGYINTGWRLDMDFKHIASGRHTIDVFLERAPGKLQHLGTRHISIIQKNHASFKQFRSNLLPPSEAVDLPIQAHLDMPPEESTYFFNPLAPYWLKFRETQVVDYLKLINDAVSSSCLKDTPHYTHQIFPSANPSWDADKFSVRSSLHGINGIRLGISLYGDASYDESFQHWRKATRSSVYGVTEFHPLKPMSASGLELAFKQHANNGAAFLSFFLEPIWNDQHLARSANMFSFDPANKSYGSSQLYSATKDILAGTVTGITP